MSSLCKISWGLVFMLGVSGLAACSQPDTQANSNTQSPSNQAKPNIPTYANATPTSAAAVSVSEKSATPNPKGEAIYQQTCRICHETGTLGAPRMGDKSAWQARIAQGKDILYAHAINGFTGKTGTMPPKGGSTASDSDIKSSVDYMVDKSH